MEGLHVTLVQVLADENSLHMACDFCLSDYRTKRVVRNDAFKLITIARPSVSAYIGVTGNGFLEGKLIGQWIAQAVGWLDGPGSIDDVVEALASKAETPLSRIADAVQRRHTFVVGAMIGTQTRVSLVSNFEFFVEGQIRRNPTADTQLTVTSIKPKSAQLFATGAGAAITASERGQLETMLRSNAAEEGIQERLSQVNAEVSRRTITVSAGCYVASLHATGHGSSRPFLTDDQKGDFIPPEVEELFRRMGVGLQRAIGPDGKPAPLIVSGSTSAMGGGSPEYFREQLKLQPRDAQLRDRHGFYLVSKGKLDEAMNEFELAKTLDPSYAPAIAHLAQQYWLHRRDTAEAERLYAEAVDAAGPSVSAWILSDFAVFCDEGLAETQRARELHERAIGADNFPLAKASLGYFLLKHGQEIERGNSLLADALDEQPGNPQILRLVGQADWFYRGDREAGRERVVKACILNPADVRALRMAADMCLVLGDGASAAYYYRKLMKRCPADWQIEANYGLALLMDRKPDGALRRLSRARRMVPNEPVVLTNTAATLWALRRKAEATALMRQILSQAPPPEIEIEVLAMLRVAAPPAAKEMTRLRHLISSGHHGDGNTIRIMGRGGPKADRDVGLQVADVIEGKAAVPPIL
jgi:Tfp pilus assembly protein PilF